MIGEVKQIMDSMSALSKQNNFFPLAKSGSLVIGNVPDSHFDGAGAIPETGSSFLPPCRFCGLQFPEATSTAFCHHQELCYLQTTGKGTGVAVGYHPIENGGRHSTRVDMDVDGLRDNLQLSLHAEDATNARPVLPHANASKFGYCTRNQMLQYKDHRALHKQKRERQMRLRLQKDLEDMHIMYCMPKREVKKIVSPEPHSSEQYSAENFFSGLGLITNASAQIVRGESKNNDVDLDCQIIAVEGPMLEMQSPRTTRSLIQHTRKSMEEARRRLSYGAENGDFDEFEVAAARSHPVGSLLNIPISSPLGLKLKKHMKKDPAVIPGSIDDFDIYCLTSVSIDDFTSKLRQRANDYPVMKGKRKGFASGYCHILKFNGAERKEFMRTLQTGLNNFSRVLKRQCRKCLVKLHKLRPEEIRYWTMKRRTIVNQEIAIDDDISIMQVEVPEEIFSSIQKMPVPLLGENEVINDTKSFLHGRSGSDISSIHHHSYHPSILAYTGPSASSSLKPQFLMKTVNKSWTESGRESQKRVFVPLDGGTTAHHPAVVGGSMVIRNMQVPSSQQKKVTDLVPSSGGVQKSLPKHLRPCPRSRKLVQDDDFVSTDSSSEEEDSNCQTAQKEQSKNVYPLTLSRTSDNVMSVWSVSDHPVPQMLHVNSSASLSNSVQLLDMVPVLPVSLPAGHHLQIKDGAIHQVVPNMSLNSSEVGIVSVASTSQENGKNDWPTMIISDVYSAEDLSNKQLFASLGLDQEIASHCGKDVLMNPQPNFLQVNCGQSEMRTHTLPLSLPAIHVSHVPSRPVRMNRGRQAVSNLPVFSAKHVAQAFSSSILSDISGCGSSNNNASNNHGKRPHLFRNPPLKPPPPPLPSPPPPPIKLPSPSLPVSAPALKNSSTSKDWKVVRVSDDDVVEVIYIDD